MSVDNIIMAAGSGSSSTAAVSTNSDPYYDNVSLLISANNTIDQYFANVSLLLTGDDLLDKSNYKSTVTNSATAVTSNTSIKKFGTSSLDFTTASRYLTVPNTNMQFGTGDFTVEFWLYYNSALSTTSYGTFLDNGGQGIFLSYGSPSTNLLFFNPSYASGAVGFAHNMANNTWNHIAFVRYGTFGSIYVNGISIGSVTLSSSANLNGSGTTAYIGAYSGSPGSSYTIGGYIDDFRVTKGTARYIANFTPPVKALPPHEILDSSVYRVPVTTSGNTRIDIATKKYGTGSMYFDGSGDYLLIPVPSLGTADFTIEGWFNNSSQSTGIFQLLNSSALPTGTAQPLALGVYTPTVFNLAYSGSTGLASTGSFTASIWNHFAVVRYNGVLNVYLNGQVVAGHSNLTDTYNYVNTYCWVGGMFNTGYVYNGYIEDFRITKGIARYTSNFPVPTKSFPVIPTSVTADPWWGNVSLLLDGNTTDAYDPYWQNVSLMLTGDDFIDWSNQHNAVTNNGTVTLNSSIKKYNSSSYNFDGSQKLISSNTEALLTSNFTMELWAYRIGAGTGDRSLLDSGGGNNFLFRWNASGVLQFYIASSSAVELVMSYTYAFPLTTWIHFAVVRNGTAFTMYVNGNSVATGTSSTSLTNNYAGGPYTIGICGRSNYSSDFFQGNIADIRITKGIARYTANFTPPIAALPSYKIQDRTQNNLTVTPYGNVQLSTDVMRYGTGSMYFDGTGDYVQIEDSPNLSFNTTDNFTVEWWMMPLGSGHKTIVLKGYYGISIILYSNQLQIGKSYSSIIYYSNTVFTSGNWYHCALVRNLGTLSLYVNGVFDKSAADATDFTTSLPMTIGVANAVSPDYFFNGYIDDFRITKGVARYISNFVPPSQSFATQYISTGYDANYADVSLLLNGNGTNGSNTFTDLSSAPKTITVYGDTKISTAVKKYGTGAIAFDGTGDYLTVPNSSSLVFGTGDFTVEAWINLTSIPSANFSTIAGVWDASTGYGWVIQTDPTMLRIVTTGLVFTSASWAPATNIWYHIAVSRSSGSMRIFVNGAQIGTTATVTGDIQSTFTLNIGMNRDGGSSSLPFNGYMDDFRITKGIARYTTNFTPPTYQLPTDSTGTVVDPLLGSTSLLLRGNGTNGSTSFTDESPNWLTVTNNGSVTVNTTTKKYGTGSMYFDGTSTGALTVAASVSNKFASNLLFTIEFWVYPNSTQVQSYPGIFYVGTPGNTGFRLFCNHIAYPNKLFLETSSNGNVISNSNISYNTWSHITIIGTSAGIYLYINGVLDASVTGTMVDSTSAYPTPTIFIGSGNENTNTKFTGYIDDFRITKGVARYAANTNFTPPTYEDSIVTGNPVDYNFAQVALLINGNGTNGSTTFTDSSSNKIAISMTNTVTCNTSIKKYGTGSLYYSGVGNYLYTATSTAVFNYGTSDLTIEGWYYKLGTTGNGLNTYFSAGSYGDGILLREQDGLWMGGGNVGNAVLNNYYSTNTWFHLAFVRSGNTITVYIDGISRLSITRSNAINPSTALIYIGAAVHNPGSEGWYGHIDDFRVTKGVARYTANFTPQPYENQVTPVITLADYYYANTTLLLTGDGVNGSNTFTDLSSSPKTITAYGNVQISTAVKKYGTGSMSFSGGNYLSPVGDGSIVNFGTGDFTIEFWFYPSSTVTTTNMILDCRAGGVGNNISIYYTSSYTLYFWSNNGNAINAGTISANTWYHLAISRISGITKMFLNGLQVGSNYTDATNYSAGTNMPRIGRSADVNFIDYFSGYMDDLRITKGVARYTGTFTPPTAPLPIS